MKGLKLRFQGYLAYKRTIQQAQDQIDSGLDQTDLRMQRIYYLVARRIYQKYLNEHTFRKNAVREKLKDLERRIG